MLMGQSGSTVFSILCMFFSTHGNCYSETLKGARVYEKKKTKSNLIGFGVSRQLDLSLVFSGVRATASQSGKLRSESRLARSIVDFERDVNLRHSGRIFG
jgi:hypothetical protein